MNTGFAERTVAGKYRILRMRDEFLDGSMEVMRKSFFIDEPVSIACELHKHPDAIKELEEMCIHVAENDLSLVAIENGTGKIVAAAFNHLQVANDSSQKHYFSDLRDRCKTPSAKCLLNYMRDIEEELNIFEHFSVNTVVEIMFLATLKEHRGNGLAKALFQATIDLCKSIKYAHNSTPCPQLVSALCSSFITQKVSNSLGFQTVAFIDYAKWEFNGHRFDKVIEVESKGTSIDCFLL